MLTKLSICTIALLSLSACATAKVDTQPVSNALEPMAQPAKYVGAVWKSQRDGEIRETTRIALTDTEETWRNSDGCEYMRPTTGFGPSLVWSGCSGADGSQEVSV